jgi:hypothetical protein
MGSGDVVDKMLPRVEGYKGARGNPKFFVQGKTWTRYPNPNPYHAGEKGGADRWGRSMRWGRLAWGSKVRWEEGRSTERVGKSSQAGRSNRWKMSEMKAFHLTTNFGR